MASIRVIDEAKLVAISDIIQPRRSKRPKAANIERPVRGPWCYQPVLGPAGHLYDIAV